MQPDIVPVILAGGEGRRLRPLTALQPKPFLKLFSKFSLLQMTLQRAASFQPPVIVCAAKFAEQAAKEAREIGIAARIIAEPSQKGTAAAVASAAFLLQAENSLMLVMPSDHVIDDAKIFEATVRRAAALPGPVLLGRRPDSADPRFGYIRTRPVSGAFVLEGFVEKPPLKIARRLTEEAGTFWNTGIFMVRAGAMTELLARHAPEIADAAARAMVSATRKGDFILPAAGHYKAIPAQPIDRAVMERLRQGMVLPLETGWHDVGCWERLLALKLNRTLSFSRHEPGR